MKSLFVEQDFNEILERFNKLTPSTQHQWGKMNVSQMLAHCAVPLQLAIGDSFQKRTLMGYIFGNMVKKKLTGDDKPFRKNSPTDKRFVVSDERNFDEEKQKLISIIRRFNSAGPAGLKEDHPFFGKMSPEQWDTLMWKHLDHHLRQFGV
jgi:hypothetical protein